jgi:hypothetical protein
MCQSAPTLSQEPAHVVLEVHVYVLKCRINVPPIFDIFKEYGVPVHTTS